MPMVYPKIGTCFVAATMGGEASAISAGHRAREIRTERRKDKPAVRRRRNSHRRRCPIRWFDEFASTRGATPQGHRSKEFLQAIKAGFGTAKVAIKPSLTCFRIQATRKNHHSLGMIDGTGRRRAVANEIVNTRFDRGSSTSIRARSISRCRCSTETPPILNADAAA